jgi:SAM-dependent methyltransferase
MQKPFMLIPKKLKTMKYPWQHMFREYHQMPKLDQIALNLCEGSVLDIGAGAGCHSLYLQNKNHKVSSVEISEKACNVMIKRGIQNIFCTDVYDFNTKEKFDTALLLMNGIGLAEDLNTMPKFLNHIFGFLKDKGKIIFDSSDICYLYLDNPELMPNDTYFGEINFKMNYRKVEGNWFKWLYIDFDTAHAICEKCNYSLELIAEGDHYDYLATISRK